MYTIIRGCAVLVAAAGASAFAAPASLGSTVLRSSSVRSNGRVTARPLALRTAMAEDRVYSIPDQVAAHPLTRLLIRILYITRFPIRILYVITRWCISWRGSNEFHTRARAHTHTNTNTFIPHPEGGEVRARQGGEE